MIFSENRRPLFGIMLYTTPNPAPMGGGLPHRADPPEEAGEVVGDMIDMRGLASLELPALAKDLARLLRHHQHRDHAERMRDLEVARQVLEHRGAARLDAVTGEEAVIGLRKGLRLELGGGDVEYVLEMPLDLGPA